MIPNRLSLRPDALVFPSCTPDGDDPNNNRISNPISQRHISKGAATTTIFAAGDITKKKADRSRITIKGNDLPIIPFKISKIFCSRSFFRFRKAGIKRPSSPAKAVNAEKISVDASPCCAARNAVITPENKSSAPAR